MRSWWLREGGPAARPPPAPPPQGPREAASPAHLDAVLLQVQVPRVDGDAGRHFGQLSPGADHPTGLVAAGAGRRLVRMREELTWRMFHASILPMAAIKSRFKM